MFNRLGVEQNGLKHRGGQDVFNLLFCQLHLLQSLKKLLFSLQFRQLVMLCQHLSTANVIVRLTGEDQGTESYIVEEGKEEKGMEALAGEKWGKT